MREEDEARSEMNGGGSTTNTTRLLLCANITVGEHKLTDSSSSMLFVPLTADLSGAFKTIFRNNFITNLVGFKNTDGSGRGTGLTHN